MSKLKNMEQDKLSFCETASATGSSQWHIRRLTERGRYFGGGADTYTLCGRKPLWDLNVDLSDHHLKQNCCNRCFEVFKNIEEEP